MESGFRCDAKRPADVSFSQTERLLPLNAHIEDNGD